MESIPKFGFIHRRFQLMMMGFGLSIGLICTALLYAGIRIVAKPGTDLQATNKVAVLVLLVAVAISVLAGWILSTRVARPLKEMQMHFKSVSLGQMPTRLHFRKNDFFQEVADAYNEELEVIGLLPKDKREARKV